MTQIIYVEESEHEKRDNKFQKEKEDAFGRYLKGEVNLVQRRIQRVSKEYSNGDTLFETVTQYVMVERQRKPAPEDIIVTQAYYESLKGIAE